MLFRPRALASQALHQPGIRALLVLFVLVSLYAVYGSLFFYRDPLSIFFSPRHGFDQFYSAVRKAEADAFLDAVLADPDPDFNPDSGFGLHTRPSASHLPGKAGDDPQICAVFITVGRKMEGRQYIDTAVGSFLANMTRAERAAVHLKLFFADVPDPAAQHPSFAKLSGSRASSTDTDTDADTGIRIADEVFTYNSTLPPTSDRDRTVAKLAGWASDRGNKHALERKTVHDYAYAMDRCARDTDAPYIALFEGDILLADGWAARTLLNLRALEAMMRDPRRRDPERGRVEPGRPNSWLYLRLFNQERSTGWSGGTGFRSNNAHIISAGVAIPLFFVLLAVRRSSGRSRRPGSWSPSPLRRHLDLWTLVVICFVAVPLWTWLFFASGKASVLGAPAPGTVREEFFGCCNQALVYNRAHAGPLATSMLDAAVRRSSPGRSDMLPKVFARDRGLARVSAYPMLAQHLGRVSAIDTSGDEAMRVWSMAFENLDREALARGHRRDVRELWGEEAALELEGER
ncbi:hypothetical protein SLS62_000606 [Diatrype stigma]|uniref:Integral membrane protein n=1 Tax=Diatrype stigma TaxID=117547 RepID=A0AAN9V1N7_9PEZI